MIKIQNYILNEEYINYIYTSNSINSNARGFITFRFTPSGAENGVYHHANYENKRDRDNDFSALISYLTGFDATQVTNISTVSMINIENYIFNIKNIQNVAMSDVDNKLEIYLLGERIIIEYENLNSLKNDFESLTEFLCQEPSLIL